MRLRIEKSERQIKQGQAKKSEKGFSLIELLIVVAIILIIAAIAIPNLLRSKMAANEASAVGSVRTINTSEVTYSATWGVGYAAALSNLGGAVGCAASSTTACLIDPVLSTGTKSGYTFAAVGNGAVAPSTVLNGYEVNATPQTVGTTGQRSFCSDQSGVIRYKTTGTAIGTGAGTCATVTTILQ
jgi:type IV pilus assembly protein PilA